MNRMRQRIARGRRGGRFGGAVAATPRGVVAATSAPSLQAERLKEAQNTAACLTTFQECDMGYLMDLRKAHKDEFEKTHGVKLGFMSAFVAASTAALQEIPAVNAYIDDAAKELVYRDYCDVSVAVASPNGLVVPVLRNTEQMAFSDVEKAIQAYAMKARDGSLSLEEMSGGTF